MADKQRFPCLPFWTEDYLGSSDVQQMSPREELAYLRLIIVGWAPGELPLSRARLEQIGRWSDWDKEWDDDFGRVLVKFVERNGALVNEKALKERERVLAYRERQSERGSLGASVRHKRTPQARAVAGKLAENVAGKLAPSSLFPLPSSGVPATHEENHKNGSCHEPSQTKASQPPDEISDFYIPCLPKGEVFRIERSKLSEWIKAFDTLYVYGEIRAFEQWQRDNEAKLSQRRNMNRKVGNWLRNAGDKYRAGEKTEPVLPPLSERRGRLRKIFPDWTNEQIDFACMTAAERKLSKLARQRREEQAQQERARQAQYREPMDVALSAGDITE